MESNSLNDRNEGNSNDHFGVDEYLLFILAIAPLLKRWIHRMTGNRQVTEDVFVETTIQGWRFLDTSKGSETSVGWIRTIAKSIFFKHYRKERARRRTISQFRQKLKSDMERRSRQQNPAIRCEMNDTYGILPDDRREIFRDSLDGGFTDKELAVKYGLHINTIRKRLKEAEKFLERKFRD